MPWSLKGVTDPVSPVKRAPKTEPIRRGRQLVLLRRRMEEYAAGVDPARGPEEAPAPERGPAEAAVQAHLLGQDGQKRGLRGGPEVLDKARSTYLEREFSGRFDRRPRKGRLAKTEI